MGGRSFATSVAARAAPCRPALVSSIVAIRRVILLAAASAQADAARSAPAYGCRLSAPHAPWIERLIMA